MPIPARAASLALVLAAATLVVLPAATPFMPVDEVRPGMVGTGRTVFSGQTPEDFTVNILGVLRNVVGPQRDLILARLEGGPLAQTGVMQGMSGSPVYVDGRLLGAIAYSLGSFPKEPIAGITPIAEMVEATDAASARSASTRVGVELPLTMDRLTAALRAAVERLEPFAATPSDLEVLGLPRQTGTQIALQLRPIATPVIMNGLAGPAAGLFQEALREAGFEPLVGSAAGAQPVAGGPSLEPGDAVGVVLATGDFEMGASGTVTYVDDGRVYAFGHPFFNLGPTTFPMTQASVYSLLPSYMTSQKIARLGAVVGTVDQDRATAIAGRLGEAPALVPVNISLESNRGYRRDFRFSVVHDEFFTPLLSFLAVANTLFGYERQIGTATFTVEGTARIAGHESVRLSDVFTGTNTAAGAASYVAGPVTLLVGNEFEPVRLESIDLVIKASEETLSATVERVWLDDARPRAGRVIPLKILVREYGGTERTFTVPMAIPPNAPPAVTVLVADGSSLTQWEQRELLASQRPQSVRQMIRILNDQRRNSRLYVRLLGTDAGAVVKGEPLPSLPPSVLRVLEAERDGGMFAPLRNAVLGAWEITTDRAVTGSRLLRLTLENGRR